MLVLSVCSLKGGVGKTSVALGLASAGLQSGLSTLVVDLDPQGDSSLALDVLADGEHSVGAMLAKVRNKDPRQFIMESPWRQSSDAKLDVIPGSSAASKFDAPQLTLRGRMRLSENIDQLEEYDLVIIDCPPSLNGLTQMGLCASDRAVIVTEPGMFAVSAAERMTRAIRELSQANAEDLESLGMLVNRVRPGSVEHEFRITELRDLFGPLILPQQLIERVCIQQAQGAARPIHRWPGQGAKAMADQFTAILALAQRSVRAGATVH